MRRLKRLVNGEFSHLFITIEQLVKQPLLDALVLISSSIVALCFDEAHCAYIWLAIKADYLKVPRIRALLGKFCFLVFFLFRFLFRFLFHFRVLFLFLFSFVFLIFVLFPFPFPFHFLFLFSFLVLLTSIFSWSFSFSFFYFFFLFLFFSCFCFCSTRTYKQQVNIFHCL